MLVVFIKCRGIKCDPFFLLQFNVEKGIFYNYVWFVFQEKLWNYAYVLM